MLLRGLGISPLVGRPTPMPWKIGVSSRKRDPSSARSCMVQSVASLGDFRPVNEVTHISLVDGLGQGRVVHVRINTDGLRMVLLVPSRMEGGAVRKVSNVVDKLRKWQS